MRARIAVLAVLAALGAASAAAGRSPSIPRAALVPNAIAFRDRLHGVLGAGWESCVNAAFHCCLQGTISLTSDGGRTWQVVRTTPRPVGTLYVTRDGGHHWHGLPKLARPDLDFGDSACVPGGGVGFALVSVGGSEKRRLLETTDAGRTWRVVHRWR